MHNYFRLRKTGSHVYFLWIASARISREDNESQSAAEHPKSRTTAMETKEVDRSRLSITHRFLKKR